MESNLISKYVIKLNDICNSLKEDSIVKKHLFDKNNKLYKLLKWTNFTLAFLLLIPMIYTLFNFSIPNMVKYTFSVILMIIIYRFKNPDGFILIESIRFLTLMQLVLHSFLGGWLGLYGSFIYHDELLHITGGLWLFAFLFPFVFADELKCSKETRPFLIVKSELYALSIANTLSVIWEIGEFTSDIIFKSYPGYTLAQEGSLIDTMTDLILNNVGIILGILVFHFIFKRLRNSNELKPLLERISTKLKQA